MPKPSTITDLTAAITAGDGVARPNLFWVNFPNITSDVSTREMGLMCREVALPSRSITTVQRQVGAAITKVPYSHLTDTISMRFLVLNNAGVRTYFERWQNQITPGADKSDRYEQRQEVGYYKDFVKDITINQLKQNFELSLFSKKFDLPLPNFVKNAFTASGPGLTNVRSANSFPIIRHAAENGRFTNLSSKSRLVSENNHHNMLISSCWS